MSCTGCTNKFSIISKELSCTSCKLSYCRKCLNGHRCATNVSIDPEPLILIKRLTSLENPSKPPITVFTPNIKEGLSPADRVIAERLEKLKEDRVHKEHIPSLDEIQKRLHALQQDDSKAVAIEDIRSRLQKLRGFDEPANQTPSTYVPIKSREEQIQDLLSQTSSEVSKKSLASGVDDSEAVNKIIEEAMAAAALPKIAGDSDSDLEEMETENTNWCTLCNDDAFWQCVECQDLYCNSCLKEIHNAEHDDHKVSRV